MKCEICKKNEAQFYYKESILSLIHISEPTRP